VATGNLLKPVGLFAVVSFIVLGLMAFPASAAVASTGQVCVVSHCSWTGAEHTVQFSANQLSATRRTPASLSIVISRAPAGKKPRVTVIAPDGKRRIVSRSTKISRAAIGRWTITAAMITTAKDTYFPITRKTIAVVRRNSHGRVAVVYGDVVSNRTIIASGNAVQRVTAPTSTGVIVVVSDPHHKITAGHTLAVGVTPATPYGLLLSVTSVANEGDGVQSVTGTRASLTAIGPAADIAVAESYTDSSASRVSERISGTQTPRAAPGQPRPDFDVKGRHKFNDDLSCDGDVTGTITAGTDFSPTVSLDITWGGILHAGSFTAKAEASGVETAGIDASVEGQASCSFENDDLLATPILLPTIEFSIGVVPVVISPQLNFELAVNGNVDGKVTTGVNQSLSVSAGLDWNGKSLSPIGGVTHTFDYDPITPTATGDLTAQIGPVVTFKVDDLAGPFIGGWGVATLSANSTATPWWTLKAGLEAGGGLRFKMFGKDFDHEDDHIISKLWTIASASPGTTPPSAPLQITTSDLPAAQSGQPYTQALLATGGSAPYSWTVTGGALPAGLSLSTSGEITGTPTQTTTSTSTFAVAVSDTDGHNATKSYGLTVNGPGPASNWSSAAISEAQLDAITCDPGGALCLSDNSNGDVLTSTNPTGGASEWSDVNIDDNQINAAMSCPSSTLCLLGDSNGNILVSSDPTGGASTWNAFSIAETGVTGISCPAANLCFATDFDGNVYWTTDPASANWNSESIDPGVEIHGLDCPSISLCVATDVAGNVIASSDPAGGAWALADVDGSNDIFTVSCPSGSLCEAFDGVGNLLTSTDPAANSWTVSAIDAQAFTGGGSAISCPSASLCAAGDDDGNLLTSITPTLPSSWQSVSLTSAEMFATYCPSDNVCLAGDDQGDLYWTTDASSQPEAEHPPTADHGSRQPVPPLARVAQKSPEGQERMQTVPDMTSVPG
jgi:hypothetical protein